MEKVSVVITYSGNNFGAFVPALPGCVATGESPSEIIDHIKEAIAFHIEGSLVDNDPLDDLFRGPFELVYEFQVIGLLNYFKGIFTNAALEKMTGINQKQLQHYASGLKKPRPEQALKIERALHNLGNHLLELKLVNA